VQEPVSDQHGLSFYFAINDVPIFIKVIDDLNFAYTCSIVSREPTGCHLMPLSLELIGLLFNFILVELRIESSLGTHSIRCLNRIKSQISMRFVCGEEAFISMYVL
jgi:hypothetical protein